MSNLTDTQLRDCKRAVILRCYSCQDYDDALQDCYLAALKLPKLGRRNFQRTLGWRLVDRWRRFRRHNVKAESYEQPGDIPEREEEQEFYQVTVNGRRYALFPDEWNDVVHDALNLVFPRYKRYVVAVFWEGVDRYKLAELEECSINTVNSAINRYYKAVKILITKRFIPL